MSLPNAQLDVATRLAAAGLGTVGVNIFAVAELPQSSTIPAKAIFVQVYGGREPDDYLGQAPSGLRYPLVQVCVRAAPFDVETAQSASRAAWDALHRCTMSGYLSCRCLQSAPTYLGLNDLQQPRFSINLELMAAV